MCVDLYVNLISFFSYDVFSFSCIIGYDGSNSFSDAIFHQKLEKLLEEEKIEKPFIRKQMKFRFPERGRSGRTVLMIKNLQFGYGDEVS